MFIWLSLKIVIPDKKTILSCLTILTGMGNRQHKDQASCMTLGASKVTPEQKFRPNFKNFLIQTLSCVLRLCLCPNCYLLDTLERFVFTQSFTYLATKKGATKKHWPSPQNIAKNRTFPSSSQSFQSLPKSNLSKLFLTSRKWCVLHGWAIFDCKWWRTLSNFPKTFIELG